MTFKQLSSVAFSAWTYEQAVWIMQNDRRKLIKQVAKYVIKKKYENIKTIS